MDLDLVMDALGAAVDTIDGLTVYAYVPETVVPPAAIVGYPDTYNFDDTMARGCDRMEFPILLMVARRDGRSSRTRINQYMKGSGSTSVKAAIESHNTAAYDSARVDRVEPGQANMAGADYLSATFYVDVIGEGA